ncbi:MAG TPA: hypothetical protein VNW06_03560 [Cytophagaceae bacterium]|nr:hypothetical protein [Cytophagaceae bacterium]
MEISLSYTILEYLYEIREEYILEGRIHCIAELLQNGHSIVLTEKKDGRKYIPYTTLNNQHDLQNFVQKHFKGIKFSDYYLYT